VSYIIRKAESKDAPGIAKVQVETWQSHYREQFPEDFLSNLSIEHRMQVWAEMLSKSGPKAQTFVSEENERICGFCDVGPSRDDGVPKETGELYAIYVEPSKQGRGIGSALLQVGLGFLREHGFERATLWVFETNKSAIQFYESKGWKFNGTQRREDKRGFPVIKLCYSVDLRDRDPTDSL
jgi:ribosomal protein S18 acetylase RimI-like enzyme